MSPSYCKATEPPPFVLPPPSAAIPGVIAPGQSWKTVFAWEGNNIDGPIADRNGAMLVANNDAGSVMRIGPAAGRARVLYKANTAGAVSRSKSGALFVAERGLPERIVQLEPSRKVLADRLDGEPLECLGGVINDISADRHGGVYVAVSGGGLLYASPSGRVTRYGQDMGGANGIILSPDETRLYVGNGPVMFFGFDDTWRWRFRNDEEHFDRFWLQSVRVLARSRVRRPEVRVEDKTEFRRGEKMTVQVRFPIEAPPPAGGPGKARVKLAVLVVFDQLRGDYLDKWRPLFGPGGFARLQTEGAWFTRCNYPYATTTTGPGHAFRRAWVS